MTSLDLLIALGDVDEALIDPVVRENPGKRRRPVLRAALIAAAVLALLAAAALAVGSGLLKELFPEHYDQIAAYVLAQTAVTENSLVRLTAESAVTDGAAAYLIYSVERLDGGSMADLSPDAVITPRFAQGGSNYGGIQGGALVTGQETEGKRWFIWQATGRKGMTGVELRLLGLQNMTTGERLDTGELTLRLDLTACPVRLGVRTGQAAGEEWYPSIVLSPLSLNIQAYQNLQGKTAADAESFSRKQGGAAGCTLALRYRDGMEQDLTDQVHRTPNGAIDELRVLFTQLVAADQVEAVVIDGTAYPLADGEAPPARGVTDTEAPRLEMDREYVYGAHTPVHPKLEAAGAAVTLSLDGIWTDGVTAELFLKIQAAEQRAEYWSTVNLGGWVELEALDKAGKPLAVGALPGGAGEGLLGLVVECGGDAESLTIRLADAALTIPLTMQKLQKLPQVAPQQASPRRTPAPDREEAFYQTMYDELFSGVSPDGTGYAGDNGLYRLTFEQLYLEAEAGAGRLRAIARAERLDGGAFGSEPMDNLKLELLSGGEARQPEGSGGGFHGSGGQSESQRMYWPDISIQGEFTGIDALRLTWTPPEGERITLELPVTEK